MPPFNLLKSYWDRLSANWTPFATGNQPYLIPYHQDIPAHRDDRSFPGRYESQVDHNMWRQYGTERSPAQSRRPAFQARVSQFNVQGHVSDDQRYPSRTSSKRSRKRTSNAVSLRIKESPWPCLPPAQDAATHSPEAPQPTNMPRKSRFPLSSSSSSDESNSSKHHARKARKRMQRIFSNRGFKENTPTAMPHANPPPDNSALESAGNPCSGQHRPLYPESDVDYHIYISTHPSTTITGRKVLPTPQRPSPPHLPRPSPERRPLIPQDSSPQVSRPAQTTYGSLMPSPDLEAGDGTDSDSSYEGLDVFGRREPRRWDLGTGQRYLRVEECDGCLMVWLFSLFVVVVVGGAVVMIWVLLHQS